MGITMSIDTNATSGNEDQHVETTVEAVETPSEGTQPSAESNPTPAPEIPQGSDYIPKSRFNEVIAERNRERAEKAALMQMLQQRQQQAEPQQPPQVNAPQPPKQEDFSNYEQYIEARAEFKAKQAAEQTWKAFQAQQQQQAQQQAEQARIQTAETNWAQKAYEASVKYSDFTEKVSNSMPLTNAYAAAVLKASPMAGDLAYHLASNPDLVARLNGMHPIDAAAELGRVEGKLAGSPTPPKVSVSKAPKPISPVGTGKTPSPSQYRDDMTDQEYLAWRHPRS